MSVVVRSVNGGNSWEIRMMRSRDTVRQLKERLQQQATIPASEQRLIFSGDELHDDATLNASGMLASTQTALVPRKMYACTGAPAHLRRVYCLRRLGAGIGDRSIVFVLRHAVTAGGATSSATAAQETKSGDMPPPPAPPSNSMLPVLRHSPSVPSSLASAARGSTPHGKCIAALDVECGAGGDGW